MKLSYNVHLKLTGLTMLGVFFKTYVSMTRVMSLVMNLQTRKSTHKCPAVTLTDPSQIWSWFAKTRLPMSVSAVRFPMA